MGLKDAKILLNFFIFWASILKNRYNANIGTDSTNSVTFEELNGITSISFTGERTVAVSYNKNENQIIFHSATVPTDVSLFTLMRLVKEISDWTDRGFKIWWNAIVSLPKVV